MINKDLPARRCSSLGSKPMQRSSPTVCPDMGSKSLHDASVQSKPSSICTYQVCDDSHKRIRNFRSYDALSARHSARHKQPPTAGSNVECPLTVVAFHGQLQVHTRTTRHRHLLGPMAPPWSGAGEPSTRKVYPAASDRSSPYPKPNSAFSSIPSIGHVLVLPHAEVVMGPR